MRCYGDSCSCRGGFPHHKDWGPAFSPFAETQPDLPKGRAKIPNQVYIYNRRAHTRQYDSGAGYKPYPTCQPNGMLLLSVLEHAVTLRSAKGYTHFRYDGIEVELGWSEAPEELWYRVLVAAGESPNF